MIRILVSDPIDPRGLALFKENNTFEVVETKDPKNLEGFDAWLVRSETKVTKEKIAQAKNLKIIGRAGTGVDNIDVDEATRRGVLVVNVPGANAIAVSEHVFALLLSLARKIPSADQKVKEGLWRDKSLVGTELYGKTLGILGLGRVGREVASRAKAFQMKILGYDPFLSAQTPENFGVNLVTLEEVLATADIITIHVPLTENTRKLINKETLAKTKRGMVLINTSRGEVVDEEALAGAIEEGRVAGAALDVFEREPLGDSPLKKLGGKVVLTPHLGATTQEAQLRVATELARNVIDFFERGIVRGGVNLPAEFDPDSIRRLEKHLSLAERLGKFLGQVTPGAWQTLELKTSKSFSEKDQKILQHACLRGLLACALGDKVNMVNAALYAAERKLQVRADYLETPGPTLEELCLSVQTAQGKTTVVSGWVEMGGALRILRIGELFVDVHHEGNLIVIENQDKPGMIGHVGASLGKHKINIADMRVGRKAKGKTAIMVLTIDDALMPAALKQLEKLDGVTRVTLVSL